jgi:hypothetical protein
MHHSGARKVPCARGWGLSHNRQAIIEEQKSLKLTSQRRKKPSRLVPGKFIEPYIAPEAPT